jgi:hypothetical protein
MFPKNLRNQSPASTRNHCKTAYTHSSARLNRLICLTNSGLTGKTTPGPSSIKEGAGAVPGQNGTAAPTYKPVQCYSTYQKSLEQNRHAPICGIKPYGTCNAIRQAPFQSKKSASICALIRETLTGQVCEKPFFLPPTSARSFLRHHREALPIPLLTELPKTPAIAAEC